MTTRLEITLARSRSYKSRSFSTSSSTFFVVPNGSRMRNASVLHVHDCNLYTCSSQSASLHAYIIADQKQVSDLAFLVHDTVVRVVLSACGRGHRPKGDPWRGPFGLSEASSEPCTAVFQPWQLRMETPWSTGRRKRLSTNKGETAQFIIFHFDFGFISNGHISSQF